MSDPSEKWTPFGREFARLIASKYRTTQAFLDAANLRRQVISRWMQHDEVEPDERTLARAAAALGMPSHELRALRNRLRAQPTSAVVTPLVDPLAPLSNEQIRAELHDRGATYELIDDWALWASSDAAKWHIITPPFLQAFLNELEAAIEEQEERAARIARAASAGNAAALRAKGAAARVRPPDRPKP